MHSPGCTALALAGVLLLLLPAAAAQGDPGLRPPIAMGAAVTAVAAASSTGAFGAGTEDPGSILPTTPDPDLPVWFLRNSAGDLWVQEDHADPAQCLDPDDPLAILDAPGVPDDCDTDVVAVAVSADGGRIVAAGNGDAEGQLVLGTRQQGPVHRINITGEITAVRLSGDGTIVAAATDVATEEGGGGRLYLYRWSQSVQLLWMDGLDDALSHLALSPDGASIAAGAGDVHYRYKVSGGAQSRVADDGFPGDVLDLQASDHAIHISIAGAASGHLVLYDDDTAAGMREVRAKHDNRPLDAVAITRDGTRIAVGNDQGGLWVYDLGFPSYALAARGQLDLPTGITDLQFSGDGTLLAVANSGSIQMYDLRNATLDLLWQDSRSGLLPSIALGKGGDVLVAASGQDLLVYDAVHNVTATTVDPPASITPGTPLPLRFRVENHGNRVEELAFSALLPENWTATVAPASMLLAPGAQRTVTATVTAPASEVPGNATVRLHMSRFPETPVTLQVPQHDAWSLVPDELATSRGTDGQGAARFTFRIHNEGNVAGMPPLSVGGDDPAWQYRLSGHDAPLSPGESAPVTLTIQAPDDAAELATATATIQVGGAVPATLEYTATVGALFRVGLEAPSGHRAEAGNETRFQVTVRNEGNTVDGARLELGAVPQSWRMQIAGGGREHIVPLIGPGDAQVITIAVLLPDDAQGGPPYQISLAATSLADPGERVTRLILVTVDSAPPTGEGDGRKIPAPGLLMPLAGAFFLAWTVVRGKNNRK